MANIVFLEPGTDATGDLAFWDASTGTAASATDQSHTGPRSIKLSTGAGPTTANVRRNGLLADAGRSISYWFRASALPAANDTIALISQSGGSNVWTLRFDTDGTLSNRPAGATSVNGTTVISTGTWYQITISYTITNTTTFRFELYINGILESSATAGTLTFTSSDRLTLRAGNLLGTDFNIWFDDVYITDAADYSYPGDVRVTAKKPAVENTTAFDTAVGNARGATDYNNVNEVPLSETNGWEHRGIAWVSNGTLASVAGGGGSQTTLTITAPTTSVNDLLIAYIHGNNNQDVSPPNADWTPIVEVDNTANMRSSIYWKRAVAADSGASFNFTKAVDDNLLFAGLIANYKGVIATGNPIDATSFSQSLNASSDTVTYAAFNPTETNAFVIAASFYNNDLTTAGAIAGTDPAYTNHIDVETTTGADCSIFSYDGVSSGADTGARSHSTTSTTDAINSGFQFGLIPQAQENYTLETVSAGDLNISGATILGYTAWLWGKASATTGSPTAALIVNGSAVSITLTTTSALYTNITTSATYPSNAAGIGMRSTGTVNDTFLYECGIVVAYIPGAGGGTLINGGPILQGSLIRGGRLTG